jgi:glyoxylase-like metal-dependent hydrolase (beta-lactamase superfamily II)
MWWSFSPVWEDAPVTSVNIGGVSAQATGEGIFCLTIPTPWAVGPVNVYLIEDDPLTLIDTGPVDAVSVDALEREMEAHERRIEDLERVVVTHQHVDHWGLARAIVDRSGAELCALAGFDGWLARFPASLIDEGDFAEDLLRRHGGPVRSETGTYRADVEYAAAASVDRALVDGDVLGFADRQLAVLHRPGHSPSDTVLHDEQRGILFGADHVLAWPSTAILSPALDGSPWGDLRPRALADYRASLRATQALELDVILTGHGDPVRDHRDVIANRLSRYDRITADVRAVVTAEPQTAAEIARALRGPVDDSALFFVLCDVLGHLDELLDAGVAVEREDEDGLSRFGAFVAA